MLGCLRRIVSDGNLANALERLATIRVFDSAQLIIKFHHLGASLRLIVLLNMVVLLS